MPQTQDIGAAWDPVDCGKGGSGICIELVAGMAHYDGPGGFERHTVYPAVRAVDRNVLE